MPAPDEWINGSEVRCGIGEPSVHACEVILLTTIGMRGGCNADGNRVAQVVELRFFGRLHEQEIAQILGVSVTIVKRDCKVVRGSSTSFNPFSKCTALLQDPRRSLPDHNPVGAGDQLDAIGCSLQQRLRPES